MKLISKIIIAAALGCSALLMAAAPLPALADDMPDPCAEAGYTDLSFCSEHNNSTKVVDTARNVINTMLFIVGILAVVMIIFSGIRYVMSAGNAQRVTQAKNILIYSVTGLIVALLAFAIVNFVLSILK